MKYLNILKILAVTVIVLSFSGCYLFTQGTYLFRYMASAQSTQKILEDSTISNDTRKFINLVNDIRQFSFDTLHLALNDNYTHYVKVDRDHLVDVVSAAEELSFRQHMWCFPFFGCFPNKGYFRRGDAEKEAAKLKKNGYDVIIDEVDAFSTLGILSDPLYSFMEEFTEFQLASMIIHEQTHATLFIKNQLQFNEELATFIGTEGALQFVRNRHNNDSTYLIKITTYMKDQDTYLKLLRQLYAELNMLYKGNSDSTYIREQKNSVINQFKKNINESYDSLFRTPYFRSIENLSINNAFLAIRMTYTMDLAAFDSLRDVLGGRISDVLRYVKTLKKSPNPKSDISAEIDRRLKNNMMHHDSSVVSP